MSKIRQKTHRKFLEKQRSILSLQAIINPNSKYNFSSGNNNFWFHICL